nr:hypothetical protein [Tanacetum cinerariifolium]
MATVLTPMDAATVLSTKIAQSSALPPVADEPASPLRDVSEGEACPTDFGFEADQDRTTIAKTSTLPHDSAPRVTSLAAAEGSMQQTLNELTAFCTSLQRKHSELISKFEAQELEINRLKAKVKLLEDREGVAAERSGDDAPIKGRNLDEGEAAAERVSDDTEEMATILTFIDAATVLASRVAEVPTGSGSIPIASPPADVVPIAGLIFATATMMARQLEEEMKRDAQRMNEQIARDAEIARIQAEEELRIELISDLTKYQDYAKVYKFQTQQRKPWSKNQKRDYYMAVIRSNLGWKVNDFRGMTFEEIEAKFTTVWKQIKDFIPIGLKEEAERFKRKGIRFKKESVKKLKTSEEVAEEAKSPDEVPKEKVKEMMQLVPIKEVEDLIQLWALVKESLSNKPPTSDKEMELWVELKRLYELDGEDQLWTHTQNLMHAPVEWKLYDTCGVHHVTSRDKKIFMLVEKDYPLRKGLAIMMICYKLQVENYSQMANDLILKIHKIASRLTGASSLEEMHKAFPLPVIEFPLPEEVPTASEESSHCQKKREAAAVKIALLPKSKRNCQSKLDAVIQITLSENIRSHQETKTERLLLEDLGAIAVKKGTKDQRRNVSYDSKMISLAPTIGNRARFLTLTHAQFIMGELLSHDRMFDFPIDDLHPAYDFFASGPLPGYTGNPNNMNGWIEADVPLLGELGERGEPLGAEVDELLVDPVIDELAEPIVEEEEQMDDEEVWEMDKEWLMAPVTPTSMPVMPPPSTYEQCCKIESTRPINHRLRDTRPPTLPINVTRMELYIQNRENKRMILESVEHGPLIWPTIKENEVTMTKKYAELSATEKIQAAYDLKATNIILLGLPSNIYSLVNHHRVAKDLWEKVQLLMQGQQRVVKCFNCQGEGHMARQCPKPKRKRDATWFREKFYWSKLKEKEAKNIDTEIALEKKVKELDNIVYKMGQSAQIVHMLMKPQVFYDSNLKQALGFQNPFYLKKAQQIRPMFNDGNVITKETNVTLIADSEVTLMLEEENFGKHFVPQQELSDEQALHPITDQSTSSLVKIEAPRELPKRN